MTSRAPRPGRRVAAGLLALASVAGLSGCQKDSPTVSVFSGRHFVHSRAQCYAYGSTPITEQQCRQQSRAIPVLRVQPGVTIGIDVDNQLAERGWVPAINGQRLTQDVLRSRYFRFDLRQQALAQAPFLLQVLERGGDQNKGVWAFQLERDSGS